MRDEGIQKRILVADEDPKVRRFIGSVLRGLDCSFEEAVDVFDALNARRDYPKYTEDQVMGFEGMDPQKVIGILMSDSGSHFDPGVAAFFRGLLKVLDRYRGIHFSHAYADGLLKAAAACPPGETEA